MGQGWLHPERLRHWPRRSRPARAHLVSEAATRCPIITRHFENAGEPCGTVIEEQWTHSARPKHDEWQSRHLVPEPWSGHIDKAPILFVASNPSLGAYQAHLDAPPPTGFPTIASSDRETETYFDDRFDGRIVGGIRNEGDSTIVRFWKGVLSIAEDLMPDHEVRPGIDYALTELVRCKSKSGRTLLDGAPFDVAHHGESITLSAGHPVTQATQPRSTGRLRASRTGEGPYAGASPTTDVGAGGGGRVRWPPGESIRRYAQ